MAFVESGGNIGSDDDMDTIEDDADSDGSHAANKRPFQWRHPSFNKLSNKISPESKKID